MFDFLNFFKFLEISKSFKNLGLASKKIFTRLARQIYPYQQNQQKIKVTSHTGRLVTTGRAD